MAIRIGWDKFEVALLIDACNQVLNKKIAKSEIVIRLSAALRSRAVEQGVKIDEIFRNENGISLQMTKMDYLLTDGKIGLPGASKLYAEIAELSKSKPADFAKLLVEAKEQIGVKEAKVNMSNKEMFSQWLSVNTPKIFKPNAIITALDKGFDYCKNHGLSKESLWDLNDISKFSSITSRLLSMRIFRLTHRSTVSILDKAVPLYRTFLKENINAKEDSHEVSTQQESVVKENNPPSEPAPKYEAPPVNMPDKTNASLVDEETLSDKLYVALEEESRVNKYGTTLMYLATKVGAPEKSVKAILASAEWVNLQYGRYSFNYAAIQNEMKYNFEKPQSLAYTRPVSVTYFEDTVIRADTWRQMFLDFLKVIYEDYPHYILQIKGKVYAGAALPIIADAVEAENMRAPKEFADGLFVETNRSADDIVDTIKKLLDICNTDYENVVITYESKSTSAGTTKETAGVSNKSDVSSKSITIVEAVSIVLQKARKPWTTKEIYDQIIADKLYTFGAQDPIHVVEVKINAACKGSNYSYKAPQELFGFIREDGTKKYYLLSREKEIVKTTGEETMPFSQSSEIRTETDSKLAKKYPVLFKRIYSAMKEYGNISVSAQDVLDKVGKIARLSTVKRVLDYASWSEHVGSNYRYSVVPINYTLPEDQPETQPTISNENEFYHWLETSNGLSSADCSRYTSGINVISRFLNNECHELVDIYTVQESTKISDYFITVENHSTFKELAQNQKSRLSESMRLYRAYLAALEGANNKEAYSAARAKEKDFRQWAALKVGPDKARSYTDALEFIESRCMDNHLIDRPFYESDNNTDLSKIIDCTKQKKFTFILQSANINDALAAVPLYRDFLHKDDEPKKTLILPKNIRVLDFKNIGDLAFTKPVRLKYLDQSSTEFSSWADLYAKLLFMLRIDHPRALTDGTSLSGSSSPDISSKTQNMRAAKGIGKNLYVETNHDTKGLVNRMYEALNLCGVSTKKIEIQYLVREKSLPSGGAKKVTLDPQQMSKLMSFIKAANNGVSFNDIRAKFTGVKPGALKAMLDTENAVLMNDKYYHKNNIEDFEETADIILATVQNQFQRNAGYTSAKMLYDELHVRLEDFFFDNGGFDSPVELYDLTRHLFEKIKYKGNSYIFAENKHIWENEPNYIKTYLGILSNWAKQQNNIMTRDEMIEKLIAMGSTSPTATFSYLMINENQNPSEKMFLMYDEYRYVLTEACHIDESFISSLRMNLEELFEGDDYLAFDEIDEYFYTTLPELPSGVNWSAHMIKSVLTFFDVGFFTVAVGGDNDIKIPDAAIVRKNSMYKSFSDVLWSEINKDYELPREFSSEGFREILLRKGFIHGMEKLYSVHTTVEGDLRYFWTDNNSKVTVSKK